MPLLLYALTGMHELNAMEEVKQEPVNCYSVDQFKTRLQQNIAHKDWGATLQTYDAMYNFLHDESNRRLQAKSNKDIYTLRSLTYGGLTLASLLCLKSGKTRTAASLISGSLTVHYGVQKATITPKNVFDKDKHWIESTIHPIRPKLFQFLDTNYEKNLQELKEKHM